MVPINPRAGGCTLNDVLEHSDAKLDRAPDGARMLRTANRLVSRDAKAAERLPRGATSSCAARAAGQEW